MKSSLATLAFCLALASVGNAQSTSTDQKAPDQTTPAAPATPAAAPAAPAAPAPLSSPAMTGPLANQPPLVFDGGDLGNLSVNGVISGMGVIQTNHASGDNPGTGVLTNGQVILQKADGMAQFYVQAGAYEIPSLGAGILSTEKSLSDLFGAVPVGYFKLNGKTTSLEIGALPTLIGAEYTFTFENMNIERGLLWNQEPAISKGLQLTQALGKEWSASLSWTDGFYSNRYTWLTGSLAYTKGANALSFVAGGNYGKTVYQTFASPIQNNSSIYNIIYTYTKGSLVMTPYFQYTNVPTDTQIGVTKGASTTGGAFLLSKTFSKGLSTGIRYEYIASSGGPASGSVNLLYGPGSAGESVTITPTYQKSGFFTRGEVSWVHVNNRVDGFAFGTEGNASNQLRAMVEMGFIFGDNIVKKK